ncbi:branched-chain amino acid ABC transporter permease [Pararhodobacter sp. SW119]|uniref:branched-chain amino acid ABC transporter permease n=1 Tax=Pararhodobacter sp. SW119 TaxID=2780075 RepID=UPI001ADEF6E2|nr:branched-chain amino acid ABC transporter permease [Pararhodobacter sp. SW119]
MSAASSATEPTAPRVRLLSRTVAASAIFVLMALIPVVSHLSDDPFLTLAFTRILVFAIAALSLDLILGFGALVSFGHAAYVGFGAYAVGVLMRHGVTDIFVQLACAIGLSAVFAAITGAIALRTRGVYFIMITLAFGQMAYFFFTSLSAYGGDDGMSLQNRSTVLGSDVLESNLVLFYVTLGTLVGLYLMATAIVNSRFGRVLQGTREDALRMQAIGFRPFRYQLAAFMIAGCMASVAGVLLANQAEFVSPAYMSWHRSGELIVMVILGGVGTLLGGIVGAVVVLLLEEWLSIFTTHWRMGLGLLLILVVLFSPKGIGGIFERVFGPRK